MVGECLTPKVVVMNHHVEDHHQRIIGIINLIKMNIALLMLRIIVKHFAKIYHLARRKWRRKVIMMIPASVSHLLINFPY